MKKTLFTVLILFTVALSPVLSYASNNSRLKTFLYGKTKMVNKGSSHIYGMYGSLYTITKYYDSKDNTMCYLIQNVNGHSRGFSCVYLRKKK